MYVVVEVGKKQYRVGQGDTICVDKLNADVGESLTFDKVLAVSNENEFKIGSPYVENVSVLASVLGHDKAKKITVYKYKPKTGYHKKQGHKQVYTKLQISMINI